MLSRLWLYCGRFSHDSLFGVLKCGHVLRALEDNDVLIKRDLRTHMRVLCVLARVAWVPCFLCLALECVVVRVVLCGASSVVITVTRTVEVQN